MPTHKVECRRAYNRLEVGMYCCIMLWVKQMVFEEFGRKLFCLNIFLIRTADLYVIIANFCFIWHRYVEGGMGAISSAIAKAAAESGATLVTDSQVIFHNDMIFEAYLFSTNIMQLIPLLMRQVNIIFIFLYHMLLHPYLVSTC
jgi:hypothetical protein